MLVSAIVSSSGVAFAVFVTHWSTERIEDGVRSEILRGNEVDRLALSLHFISLAAAQHQNSSWELTTKLTII